MNLSPTDNTTITYQTTRLGFFLDVVAVNFSPVPTYEAYIYACDTGIKELICGVEQAKTTYNSFLSLVCVDLDARIEAYIKEYINI